MASAPKLVRCSCTLLLLQVYIDTTGWAFPYPLAKLAGCKVACYTHYPTVSTNMLLRVWSRQAMYNNDDDISNSGLKSLFKVLYYQAVAVVYGIAGACAGMHAVALLATTQLAMHQHSHSAQ